MTDFFVCNTFHRVKGNKKQGIDDFCLMCRFGREEHRRKWLREK